MILDNFADDIPDKSSLTVGNMVSEFVHQTFTEIVFDDIA